MLLNAVDDVIVAGYLMHGKGTGKYVRQRQMFLVNNKN